MIRNAKVMMVLVLAIVGLLVTTTAEGNAPLVSEKATRASVDVAVASDFPDSVYPFLDTWVEYDGSRIAYVLLRFDLDPLTQADVTAGMIEDATVDLWVWDWAGDAHPEAYPFLGLHQVTTPWGDNVTWNTRPLWDATEVDAQLIDNWSWYDPSQAREKDHGYYDWDVTELVKDWLNGTPNYGVLVKIREDAPLAWTRGVRFRDRLNTEHRPYLIVWHT